MKLSRAERERRMCANCTRWGPRGLRKVRIPGRVWHYRISDRAVWCWNWQVGNAMKDGKVEEA
jgi:hypothetical protein